MGGKLGHEAILSVNLLFISFLLAWSAGLFYQPVETTTANSGRETSSFLCGNYRPRFKTAEACTFGRTSMDRLEFEAGFNEIGRMLDGGIDQNCRGQLAGNSPPGCFDGRRTLIIGWV
jgi:hypothetical protein